MITLRHIEIYRKYRDGDGFIRCASQTEKNILDYEHWFLIDGFVQDISTIKKGLTATSFIQSTDERLNENCDTEETIQALKGITD